MSFDRRDFVKTIALAGTFGSMTLRDVIAAAVREGKRPLTTETFNRRFASLRGTAQFRQEVTEAKADLAGFLGKNFYLTPQQLQNIKALPAADSRALNAALDRAAAENLTLKLAARADQGGCQHLRPVFSPGAVTIQTAPVGSPMQ